MAPLARDGPRGGLRPFARRRSLRAGAGAIRSARRIPGAVEIAQPAGDDDSPPIPAGLRVALGAALVTFGAPRLGAKGAGQHETPTDLIVAGINTRCTGPLIHVEDGWQSAAMRIARSILLGSAAVLLVAFAGCSQPIVGSDAGTADAAPGMDAPSGTVDAPDAAPSDAVMLPDTGAPAEDAGDDAASPGTDGGADGGPAPVDAPSSAVDGGLPASDAGASGMDGGGAIDAGTDAGTTPDAGPTADAGGPCGGAATTVFYRDLDGDGHGAASSGTAMRCSAGAGYVGTNDDCDDANASRFPGNPELCNNLNDDCDAVIDGPAASASCTVANGTGACVTGGICIVAGCSAPFDDCDGTYGNGCEVNTTSDADHCSACGMACGAADTCTASTCDGSAIVDFAGGHAVACIRRANGRVACWGDNQSGRLGIGSPTPTVVLRPTTIAGITTATDISVGPWTACATLSSGSPVCWGANAVVGIGADGMLGDGVLGTRYAMSPQPVLASVADATHVDALLGGCVIRSSGRVMCWGDGDLYGLASTPPASATPAFVSGILDAVEISGACARRVGGTVTCWGGDGGTPTPSDTGFTGVMEVANAGTPYTSGSSATCIRLSDGTLRCWGANDRAQTGVAGGAYFYPGTANTPPVTNVIDASCNGSFCCAVRNDATVWCWGDNTWGQLGRTASGTPGAPMAIPGLAGITRVEAGTDFACAINAGGALLCWGRNFYGQLGDGTTIDRSTPAPVRGL